MTETITEPLAPEESTPTPLPAAPGSPTAGKEVEHTPGGLPVVPLSLTGTNTAASLFATAALAGGPLAAAIAMTGAAVLGTAAAHHRKNNSKTKAPDKTSPKAARSTAGAAGRGLPGRIPAQPRTTPRPGGSAGSRKSAGSGTTRRAGGTGGLARSAGSVGKHSKPGRPSVRQRAAHAVGGLAGGGASEVRALRQQARAQSPTRAAARTAAVQARRQVADNRRAARAAERTATAAGARARGPAARTLARGLNRAAAVRDRAASATRSARDRTAGWAVANGRAGVRQAAHRARVAQLQAPAQRAARRALLRSAARFHARRTLAAALGGALGLLGMVSTPLGRRLGWAWLQHPGRRLYRFLLGRAGAEREEQDAGIRNGLEDAERAAEEQADAELEQDIEGERLGDTAARPTTHVPAAPTSQGVAVSNASGFRFEELAAEMEQAAQAYEPDNAMEILAMVEGLPEALGSIANIMRILAERSDSEFPLEKEVADGFADIYGALNSATAVAEDLGPVFRQAHEADIARHEDPRNGPDAEKGWNV